MLPELFLLRFSIGLFSIRFAMTNSRSIYSVIKYATLVLPLSLPVFGQVVVAPTAFASTEGGTSSTFTPLGGAFGLTEQILIEQSALGLTAGDTITGIAFRPDGGGSGTTPASPISYTDYSISIGQAGRTAETMSATFSDNLPSPTLVRSGGLTIPANSFTLGSTPNSFGPVLTFTTPFQYTGGDLVFEFRTVSGTSSTTPNMDTDATPAKGFGTTYNSVFAADGTATSGSQFVAPIVGLQVTPVPEPTTWALVTGLSLGAFGFVRRIRKH
jgi:hypothetical protein